MAHPSTSDPQRISEEVRRSWQSEQTDSQDFRFDRVVGQRHNTNPFLTFHILWTVGGKKKNRFHICLMEEISEAVRVSVWERQRRGRNGGEMLEATGYLSRYNGVSYEKTSVNFLSDLQQSITQSSHSADLWSRCLTESCHCSQPPTHRNSNFGLTNFPCNTILLFCRPSPSLLNLWSSGSLCIRANSKALAMCSAGPRSRKGGTGHFTSSQPTLAALIQH